MPISCFVASDDMNSEMDNILNYVFNVADVCANGIYLSHFV